MGETPIGPFAFYANLKNTFDKCGKYDGRAVRVLEYFLRQSGSEVYETYFANGTSTEAHVRDETMQGVNNAAVGRYSTRNLLRNVHDLVARSTKIPSKDKLKLEFQYSRDT